MKAIVADAIWSTEELDKLSDVAARFAGFQAQMRALFSEAELRRFEFVRWLVATGRLDGDRA